MGADSTRLMSPISGVRHDGNLVQEGLTSWYENELKDIQREAYSVMLPPQNSFRFIPLDDSFHSGTTSFEARMVENVGSAAHIGEKANDIPVVSAVGTGHDIKFDTIGNMFIHTIPQLRAAMKAGKSLSSQDAKSAREAQEYVQNQENWFGNADAGITGLFTFPNIPRIQVSNSFTADSATLVILGHLNRLAQQPIHNSGTVHRPDTLLMAPMDYLYCSQTPMSADNPLSILEQFRLNSPWIKNIEMAHEFAGSGPSGKNLAVVYIQNAMYLRRCVSSVFTILPVQANGLRMDTYCISSYGGVDTSYPKSICVAEIVPSG